MYNDYMKTLVSGFEAISQLITLLNGYDGEPEQRDEIDDAVCDATIVSEEVIE